VESKRLGSYLPALPLAERLLPILPQPKIDRFSKDRLQRRIAVVRQPVQRPGKPRIEIANDRPLPDPRLFSRVLVAGLAGSSVALTNKPLAPVAS
jgi:hypothetical protein